MKKLTITAIVLLAITIGFFTATAFINLSAEADDIQANNSATQQDLSVNDSGQSYGKLAGAPGNTTEPEMIEVVATNGKVGYVYQSDLNKVSPIAANPEEAVKQTESRTLRDAKTFISLLADDLGKDITLDDTKAVYVYEAIQQFISPEAPNAEWTYDDKLAQEIAASLNINRASLPSDSELRDYFINIMSNVQSMQTTTIPVYDKDGKTVIGEFPVGI
jgi:hypothetical protein